MSFVNNIKKTKRKQSQELRLLWALLIVACVVFFAPVAAFAQETFSGTMELLTLLNLATNTRQCDSSDFQDNVLTEELVMQISGVKTNFNSAHAFQKECFSLSDKKGVYVAEEGDLVGFGEAGSAENVFKVLAELLQNKGWIQVQSQCSTMSTFVKRTGDFRWLCLSCTDVSGQCSVVVELQRHINN